jgi:hypothetical protein
VPGVLVGDGCPCLVGVGLQPATTSRTIDTIATRIVHLLILSPLLSILGSPRCIPRAEERYAQGRSGRTTGGSDAKVSGRRGRIPNRCSI